MLCANFTLTEQFFNMLLGSFFISSCCCSIYMLKENPDFRTYKWKPRHTHQYNRNILIEWEKEYVIKIFLIECKFTLIEQNFISISSIKKWWNENIILLNTNLLCLNGNVFWYHNNFFFLRHFNNHIQSWWAQTSGIRFFIGSEMLFAILHIKTSWQQLWQLAN